MSGYGFVCGEYGFFMFAPLGRGEDFQYVDCLACFGSSMDGYSVIIVGLCVNLDAASDGPRNCILSPVSYCLVCLSCQRVCVYCNIVSFFTGVL